MKINTKLETALARWNTACPSRCICTHRFHRKPRALRPIDYVDSSSVSSLVPIEKYIERQVSHRGGAGDVFIFVIFSHEFARPVSVSYSRFFLAGPTRLFLYSYIIGLFYPFLPRSDHFLQTTLLTVPPS